MSIWTPAALTTIDAASELHVAAYRPDGTLRTPRIVWHVVVGGALYVRSVHGEGGAWYRAARRTGTGVIESRGQNVEVTFTRDDGDAEAIDAAYHDKYGDGAPVRAITSPLARETTLRVDPA